MTGYIILLFNPSKRRINWVRWEKMRLWLRPDVIYRNISFSTKKIHLNPRKNVKTTKNRHSSNNHQLWLVEINPWRGSSVALFWQREELPRHGQHVRGYRLRHIVSCRSPKPFVPVQFRSSLHKNQYGTQTKQTSVID